MKKTKVILFILLITMSMIAVFFIMSVFSKKTIKDNPQSFSFTSIYLPFSFQYPAEWGKVNEKLTQSTRGGTGKMYSLYFDNMSNVIMAGGRSIDFAESRGATEFDFYGFSDRSAEEICRAHQANVFCKQLDENKILAVRLPLYDDLCPGEPGVFGPAVLLLVAMPGSAEIGGVIFVYQFYNIPEGLCEKSSNDFDSGIERQKEDILNDLTDGALDLGGFGTLAETLEVQQ